MKKINSDRIPLIPFIASLLMLVLFVYFYHNKPVPVFAHIHTPAEFGSFPNDTLDDTRGIQSCVNAIDGCMLSDGKYKIKNTINLPDHSSILGMPGKTIISTDSNIFFFKLGNNSMVSGLTLDPKSTFGTPIFSMFCYDNSHGVIKDMTIKNKPVSSVNNVKVIINGDTSNGIMNGSHLITNYPPIPGKNAKSKKITFVCNHEDSLNKENAKLVSLLQFYNNYGQIDLKVLEIKNDSLSKEVARLNRCIRSLKEDNALLHAEIAHYNFDDMRINMGSIKSDRVPVLDIPITLLTNPPGYWSLLEREQFKKDRNKVPIDPHDHIIFDSIHNCVERF